LQKRSSISRARYLVALLAAFAVGCGGGGGDDPPSGPIPVDSDPIPPEAYVKPLGAAVEPEHAFEDDAYRQRLIISYSSITVENAMKWDIVEPDRGEFDFDAADRLMQFARRTGKRVRGDVMREHITAVMSRYRGKIDEWDVVNEPLTSEGGLKQDVFSETLGAAYIAYAFEVAHRVDPHAKLFVNELNAERPGPKSRSLLALAGPFLKRVRPSLERASAGRSAGSRPPAGKSAGSATGSAAE
jgi:endo-1,4-beta-xylanase